MQGLEQLVSLLQPPGPGMGDNVLLYTLVFSAVLGLFPALIAYMKGRNFLLWYIYGCVFFLGAIVQVMFISNAKAKPQGGATAASGLSQADELERFARLKDLGILTQAEFDAKKRQLLGLSR